MVLRVGPVAGGTRSRARWLLVRPADVADLGAALERVADLGRPGSEAVEAAGRHRPEVVAARHLEVYTEALRIPGPS